MLTIKSESFVSEKGKREVNEDSVQFESGKFYIVCDGLGGNGNGKTVSKLVAETVKESLINLKPISEAVKEAEIVLSSYKKKESIYRSYGNYNSCC
jgi:PPM family protein phosphatase